MKKIIVTGFPHCGTTILRKIIGNHPNILDVQREARVIDGTLVRKAKQCGKKGVVIKEPFMSRLGDIQQIKNKFKDYKFIMIIRNPIDIISSMNMRFNNDIPANHNFEKWQNYAKIFISDDSNFAFKLKYEEIFENDYAKLKELFKWLELEWTNDVINLNEKRVTTHNRGKVFSHGKVPPRNHSDNFRTWQVNQKIIPMIGVNRDNLDDINKNKIKNCPYVKKLEY